MRKPSAAHAEKVRSVLASSRGGWSLDLIEAELASLRQRRGYAVIADRYHPSLLKIHIQQRNRFHSIPEPMSLAVRQVVLKAIEPYGISLEDAVGRSLDRSVVLVRWAALVALARAYPKQSISWIGRLFGMNRSGVRRVLQKHGLRQKRNDIELRKAA